MDRKFVFVLLLINFVSLGFRLFDTISYHEQSIFVDYTLHNVSYTFNDTLYTCFTDIECCTYYLQEDFPLTVAETTFSGFNTVLYSILFSYLSYWKYKAKEEYEAKVYNYRIKNIKILHLIKISILVVTVLEVLTTALALYFAEYNTKNCNRIDFPIQLENASTYIVLLVLESSFLIFDFINHKEEDDKEKDKEKDGENQRLIAPEHRQESL